MGFHTSYIVSHQSTVKYEPTDYRPPQAKPNTDYYFTGTTW